MALTSNSSATPYCSPSQYAFFCDTRRTGQLVRDDGTTANPSQLLSDPVLAEALAAASGRVEAAAVIGGRYAPADLQALTGVSAAWLANLVANLAFGILLNRRGYDIQEYASVKEALADLESIRTGAAIFAFAEVEAAGDAQSRFRTRQELESAHLLTRSGTANVYMPRQTPGWGGWSGYR